MRARRIIHLKKAVHDPKALCGRVRPLLAAGTPLAEEFRFCRACMARMPAGWTIPLVVRGTDGRYLGLGGGMATATTHTIWCVSATITGYGGEG